MHFSHSYPRTITKGGAENDLSDGHSLTQALWEESSFFKPVFSTHEAMQPESIHIFIGIASLSPQLFNPRKNVCLPSLHPSDTIDEEFLFVGISSLAATIRIWALWASYKNKFENELSIVRHFKSVNSHGISFTLKVVASDWGCENQNDKNWCTMRLKSFEIQKKRFRHSPSFLFPNILLW